jgi:hypothetical protein
MKTLKQAVINLASAGRVCCGSATMIRGLSLIGFFVLILGAGARPRFPYPPLPEVVSVLFHEEFDASFTYASTNAQIASGNYSLVESWNGYALDRTGSSLYPFIVEGVNNSGHTNLMPRAGSLRFWVTPAWSSASLSGSGPGGCARLADLLAVGANAQSLLCWSLQINADGSVIKLVGQSDNGTVLKLNSSTDVQNPMELVRHCHKWPALGQTGGIRVLRHIIADRRFSVLEHGDHKFRFEPRTLHHE